MGWTGLYHKPDSIPAYFREAWTTPRADGAHLTCLGQAFVGRFTLYGVWEDSRDGHRFATVTLIRYGGKSDPCRWYYKHMDETVGPYEAKMPLTLLKKLTTPAYNDHARSWRKRCWQHALGLTHDGVMVKVRRYYKRYPEKAIEALRTYYRFDKTTDIHVHWTTYIKGKLCSYDGRRSLVLPEENL